LYDNLRGRRATHDRDDIRIRSPLCPRGQFRARRFDGGGQRWRWRRSGSCRLALPPGAWLGTLNDGAPGGRGGTPWSEMLLFGRRGRRRRARGRGHELFREVLGAPVWRILAACAVLGLYGHQLGDLVLQCPALISEFPDLLEEDAYFACEGFAEVVQVFGRGTGGESGTWWFVRSHL